jgi:predicted signal transduction protein with EAL and GGDEF domain
VGQITISAGVSDFIQGDNRESVFKKADNALYLAKNGGRNRVSVHYRQSGQTFNSLLYILDSLYPPYDVANEA